MGHSQASAASDACPLSYVRSVPTTGRSQSTQRAVLRAPSSFHPAAPSGGTPIRQSHPTVQQAKGSTPYKQAAQPPLHTTGVRITAPATPTTTTSAGSAGRGTLQAQKATVGYQSATDKPPHCITGNQGQTRPGQPPTTGGRRSQPATSAGPSSRGGTKGRGQWPLYSSEGAPRQAAPGAAS